MTHFKRILLITACLGAMIACRDNKGENDGQATSGRPNIIFLMDDQHRYDALGLVNHQVQTPTLDSLAANGIFYRQAVCQAPMCTPSRNSMMFGLYPQQTGVYRNGQGIPDSLMPAKTIAQYFKEAGYETAGFGKTHWGRYKTGTRGFETRFVSEIDEEGAVSMQAVAPEAKARYDAEIEPMGAGEENNLGYLGFTSKLPEEDHRDGWITQQAINYINNRDDDRPLFLYLSYMKPHAGHNVPNGYEQLYNPDSITYAQQPPWEKDYSPHSEGVNRRELYEGYWKNAPEEEWRLMTMRYYANVTWIDDMMGRTLEALRRRGLLENAIIVYTSDHGEMLGERYYRFNKYNLYEASVRIPMILAGTALPESAARDEIVDRPTENVDILPTLLDLAGISPDRELPGKNLLTANPRAGTFTTMHEREGEAAFMWRTKEHKLILVLARKEQPAEYTAADIITGEFYDLQKDPNEWQDLYGKPEIESLQEEFSSKLLAHLHALK